MRKLAFLLGLAALGAAAFGAMTLGLREARAAEPVRVAYAGSMGVVMDRALGPAFTRQTGAPFQGIGQGAYGLARLVAGGQIQADVFVSITPGPVEILRKAGLVDGAVPVASTAMVIVYNASGPHAAAFEAAKAGKTPWWKVLEEPGVKFGRTDPATDPQGQNIIFTFLLAQRYYNQPDLMQKVLGGVYNDQQIFAEGSAMTRLEAGQVDASSGYQSAAVSARLPFITLPDEINLSNPALAAAWYDTVSFDLPGRDGKAQVAKPQPMVFYAAVLKNAPSPEGGAAFLKFMTSPEGQKLFQAAGYGPPKGDGI
ncbi:extracellular solute-binding protein [Xanthobacter sp. V0B-10]|uniref:extracellular solute-binding protein n=1 Tax=Xanthobacter albus TaxID=3119929 RepID=UPI0037297161